MIDERFDAESYVQFGSAYSADPSPADIRNLLDAITVLKAECDQWKRACEDMLPAETQRQLEHERDALQVQVVALRGSHAETLREVLTRAAYLDQQTHDERDRLREAFDDGEHWPRFDHRRGIGAACAKCDALAGMTVGESERGKP